MKGRKIAEKYAQALFELGREEDKLQELQKEFAEVARVAEANEELSQLLEQPELTVAEKKELLAKIFADELSTTSFNFLQLLVDKKRESLLPLIYQAFKERVDKEEDKLEVTVEAAVKLSADQQKKLKEKLRTSLEKEIKLNVEEKPSLIGGLVLKTKNKVLDISFINQLQRIKNNLQQLEVS